MKCWKCGCELPGKPGFSSACEKCLTWLHTCLGCALYNPDSRRCRSLTTEYSGSPEERNFCEEFTPGGGSARDSEPGNARERFDSLFREKRNGE
jgi:hypothetical protein